MEINTSNSSAWELDSRAAAFHRNKRPHDLTIGDDHSSSGSAKSTPRKRARRTAKLRHQDVRDFVPVGASFSSTPIPLDERPQSEDEGMHVEPSLGGEGLQNHDPDQEIAAQTPQDVRNGITAAEDDRLGSPLTGDTKVFITEDQTLSCHEYSTNDVSMNGEAIPEDDHATGAEKDVDRKLRHKIGNSNEPTNSTTAPVTWNPVNSIKIRTKLGGNSHKEAVKQVEQASKDEASGETREKATQVALRRLEGFRHRLSILDPHDGPVSAYKAAESELHDAEVDYKYCLYYPTNEDFIRPPTKAERQLSTIIQEKQVESWDLVEQCMKKGNPLEDIRDGRIVARSSSTPSTTQRPQSKALAIIKANSSVRDGMGPQYVDFRNQQKLDLIEQTRRKEDLMEAFAGVPAGSSQCELLKAKIQEAVVDYNYCQFFPLGQEYLPISFARSGLHESTDGPLNNVTYTKAAQLWKLVEQCGQDGTLEDLKNGQLDACIQDVQPPTESFLASALQAPWNKHDPKPRANTLKGTMACSESRPASDHAQLVGLESDETHRGNSEARDADTARNDFRDGAEHSPDRDLMHHDQREHFASDDGVILNLKDAASGYSGPSIIDPDGRFQVFEQIPQSDLEESGNESTDNSESESESKNYSTDSEASSEDADAMIEYSNSEQVPRDESNQAQANIATSNYNARILADLNPQQLDAQLRYFHVTKTLQEVDRNTPVRCLVCARYGHMSEACESLTCTACGAYNQHVTQRCPKSAKCSKCRERGHDRLNCPYKLKNIAQAEIICDMCQRTGHTEEDCELLWRTSGRPWDSNLSHDNLRLSCYECGRSGHLGNGCPSRRPGKSPGTSSWGVGKGQALIKSGDGISIKGRAQHDPIDMDDSEDELVNFHRAKVPKPGPKGKIQINTALINPMLSQPPASQWNPINEPHRDIRATETRHPQYENDGVGNWHSMRRSGYGTPQESNYRARHQRSLSPEPRDRHRGHRIDRYQPAEPREERRPARSAPLYRPMPSAARDQWNRHRL